MKKINPSLMKVTGKCDNYNCSKDAKYWYSNTSAAICGQQKCINVMDSKYQELSDEIDRNHELEEDMIEAFGDPIEY